MEKSFLFVNSKFQHFIIYFFFIVLFLQFFRNSFPTYYIFLLFFSLCLLLITLLINGKFISSNNILTFFYYLFIIYLIISSIFTFHYVGIQMHEQTLMSYTDIIQGISRMLIMPISVLLISPLINDRKTIRNLLILFVAVFCLAPLSIFLQLYTGQIDFLGHTTGDRYHGLIPYSHTLGSVNVYGPALVAPVLLLMLYFNMNFLLKFLISFLIILGGILTMSKSALINVLLVVLIVFIFSPKKSKLYFIILFLLFTYFLFIYFPEIKDSFFRLFSNTLGFELGREKTIRTGLYQPIFERFLHRLTGGGWLNRNPDIYEFFFGLGVVGGAGAFGFVFEQNNPLIWGVPTTHNQYLDIYQIGGISLLLIFLIFSFCLNFYIYKFYKLTKDKLLFAMFFSNIVFLFNCLVYNGALFQPNISFFFWLSVIYVIYINRYVVKNNSRN